MKYTLLPLTLLVVGWAGFIAPVDFPSAKISNGLIAAELYLPDASRGYYQGTRFDWSGVMPGWITKATVILVSGIRHPTTPNCTMPLPGPWKNLWP